MKPKITMTPIEIVWRPSTIGGNGGRRQYHRRFGRYICPKCSHEFWMNPSQASNQSSCGCGVFRGTIKHGLRGHPLYYIWVSMRQRCNVETDTGYHSYGGRGIRVCNEWNDFKPFYDWCVANGWKPELKIERRNNNGNYEPGNCLFATAYEQAHNRRTNVITKEQVVALREKAAAGATTTALAKEFGIKYHTAREIITLKRWKQI